MATSTQTTMQNLPHPRHCSSNALDQRVPNPCKVAYSQFPSKLYAMLMFAERQGMESVVSWVSQGRAFRIHDSQKFMRHVCHHFFRATKLRSIHRQLSIWGFTRITSGKYKDTSTWSHASFLRSRPQDTKKIIRTKIKGTTQHLGARHKRIVPSSFDQMAPDAQLNSSFIPESISTPVSISCSAPVEPKKTRLVQERRLARHNRYQPPMSSNKNDVPISLLSIDPLPFSHGSSTSDANGAPMPLLRCVSNSSAPVEPARTSLVQEGLLARRNKYICPELSVSSKESLSRMTIDPMPFRNGSSGHGSDETNNDDEFSLFIDKVIHSLE